MVKCFNYTGGGLRNITVGLKISINYHFFGGGGGGNGGERSTCTSCTPLTQFFKTDTFPVA